MTPARWPRPDPLAERLLVVDPRRGSLADGHVADLPSHLRPGDLLVVNDAATLPASLLGCVRGEAVELRLAGETEDGAWRVVAFGAGDWHVDTDLRPPAPSLTVGDAVTFRASDGRGPTPSLTAAVVAVEVPRRVFLVRFTPAGDAFWPALYRVGRPVQYRHVEAELRLWHVQTPFAARPWAVEMPSAGRPLAGRLLAALKDRGVAIAVLTHAAGLSAVGDPALDARLPFPERYDLPAATVAAVHRADRVIAVGTSVVRALEGNVAEHGRLIPGPGSTDLHLGPDSPLRVVDGLLTGQHDPTTSHYRLLQAFADLPTLRRAGAWAADHGYLAHEFGDSTLLLAG